jgi:hypothetical protein
VLLQIPPARKRLQISQRFAAFRQTLIEPARDDQLDTVEAPELRS